MKNDDSPNENWEPCNRGVLHESADSVSGSVTRRRMLRLIGTGAVCVLIGTTINMVFTKQQGRFGIPSSIECFDVHDRLVSYAKDKISEKEMSRRITYHLMNCRHCGSEYQDILCEIDPNCRVIYSEHKTVVKPCDH